MEHCRRAGNIRCNQRSSKWERALSCISNLWDQSGTVDFRVSSYTYYLLHYSRIINYSNDFKHSHLMSHKNYQNSVGHQKMYFFWSDKNNSFTLDGHYCVGCCQLFWILTWWHFFTAFLKRKVCVWEREKRKGRWGGRKNCNFIMKVCKHRQIFLTSEECQDYIWDNNVSTQITEHECCLIVQRLI